MLTGETRIEEYLEHLSGGDPVPGGGGASALAGAYGAALGLMVLSLTTGKKRYAAFEPRIPFLREKLTALRQRFLELSDEDERVFLPLSKAYGLPQETEEEKAKRAEILEQCLLSASLVPVHVMETAVAEHGSRLAVSDAGVGAQFLLAALNGAVMNVYINIKMMQDREKAEEIRNYAEKLLHDGRAHAVLVYEKAEDAVRV